MSVSISTDREVLSLKPATCRYERAVAKARGLSVLVYPTGLKTFVVRYRALGGQRRRLALGDYPALTLAAARLKASSVHLNRAEGHDPVAARAAARIEARMGETFEDLADKYWAAAASGLHGGRRRPVSAGTLHRQQGLWRNHLKQAIGARRYRDYTRADVRALMNGYVVAGKLAPASISLLGDLLRALFAFALHSDLVEANPTLGLTQPIAPTARTRVISDDALRLILADLIDACGAEAGRGDIHARLAPGMALSLRFLLLTLSRRSEAAGARIAEIDMQGRTWTIPAERTKSRRLHVVPLSEEALRVVQATRRLPGANGSAFLFPAPGDPSSHIDPHGMTRAIIRICARRKLPACSPHDFRRTGATVLTGEAYGVRRFIVGKVLGHNAQEGAAVTAVYDRNDYLAEKRAALAAWAGHLAGLETPAMGLIQGERDREIRARRTASGRA